MNIYPNYQVPSSVDEALAVVQAMPKLIDKIVPVNQVQVLMQPDGGMTAASGTFTHVLTENAANQLRSKTGFPANKRFNENTTLDTRQRVMDELYAAHFNETPHFLRVEPATQEIVAWLTPSYHPFDNGPVMADVATELHRLGAEYQGQRVTTFRNSDRRMGLRVNFPFTEFNGPDGMPIWTGLDVYNAEDGTSSVKIAPSLFRLVCTNGMLSIHKLELGRAYHTRIMTNIHDMIAATVAKLPKFVGNFRNVASLAFNRAVPRFNPEAEQDKFHAYLGGSTRVSKAEAQSIYDTWVRRAEVENIPQHNGFALAQAISHYAHSAPPDRRPELEMVSGQFLGRGF